MFENKSITHPPSVLLLLTDRLICDIKRGVVDLDFEKTQSDIKKLFEDLYEQKTMEYVQSSEFRNVLAFYIRKKIITLPEAIEIFECAEELLKINEHKRKNQRQSRHIRCHIG